ncbi:MAG: helix-turn-helix domain-containing protein [Thermoplasmata archaeon]
MSLVEGHLRTTHPCPYQEVSIEVPGSTMLRWFDPGRSVLLLSNRSSRGIRKLIALVHEVFRATALALEDSEALALVPDLGWTDPQSIEGLAGRSGVWIVPPIVVQGESESFRVLARSQDELRAFATSLRRTGPVELLSLSSQVGLDTFRELQSTSAHLTEGMTSAQARYLVAAWDAGLFDVPSRVRWGTVSAAVGLSRSTFGEHLRKGQRRLLENSLAALRAHAGRTPERVLLPQRPARLPTGKSPLRGTRGGTNGALRAHLVGDGRSTPRRKMG